MSLANETENSIKIELPERKYEKYIKVITNVSRTASVMCGYDFVGESETREREREMEATI